MERGASTLVNCAAAIDDKKFMELFAIAIITRR
jgi:hypothetical protein